MGAADRDPALTGRQAWGAYAGMESRQPIRLQVGFSTTETVQF
jgi:hypothetical protein